MAAACAVHNLAYAALSHSAGAQSGPVPRSLVFAAGLVFFAIGYLGLGLIHSPWLVFVVLPLCGGFAAYTDGVGKAWISTLVPDPEQGTARGPYQGATRAAVLLAGVWAGLAWGADGYLSLLISGGIALVLAGGLPAAGHSRTAAL